MVKYELLYLRLTTCGICKRFNENQNFPQLQSKLNEKKYPIEIKISDENVLSSPDTDLINKTKMIMNKEGKLKVPALFLFNNTISSVQSEPTTYEYFKIDIETGYDISNNQRDIMGILGQIEEKIKATENKSIGEKKKYIKYKYKYLELKKKYNIND